MEEKTGIPYLIDDLAFQGEKIHHNGYELEKVFSIHHTRLSDLLDQDVIQEIRRILQSEKQSQDIVSLFSSYGLDMVLVQEGKCYSSSYPQYHGPSYESVMNEYVPGLAKLEGDLYYYGYWINARWFWEIKDIILKELTFPELPDMRNKSIYQEMCSESSVAVHIRRGDFIDYGWLLDTRFYLYAVAKVRETIEKPIFYIFSDDMIYVEQHLAEYGFLPSDTCIFIKGNVKGRNYIDMQLMSACRGMIIANSSFSYLAALLNRREDKLVVNPTTAREIL